MGPDARVAIYYAPTPDDPLFAGAAAWLGRDPATNAPMPQPDIHDIAAITAEPRLYGFHATLKPPMRLAEGRKWSDVVTAASKLAERIAPFDLPPLAVADVFGFLALRETTFCSQLQAFADHCVEYMDPLRALPSEEELRRRRHASLTPQQDAMLVRWGYPYVFETWFFHMTLTRRLTDDEKRAYQPAVERHLSQALAQPRQVNDICLFVQPSPGAPFVISERLKLRG